MSQMIATRNHPTYWAFVIHRLSGVGLALFLPAHFYVLSLALHGEEALDGFLRWTEWPVLKFAEAALVVLLAAHMAGGLRLLAVEFLPWREWQRTLVTIVGAFALAMGMLFLLQAF